jgi:hypothetical protein
MRANFAAAALFLIGSAIQAQSANLPPASATELRYYDRWPGAWHRVDDDRVDSLPTFVVRRGPGNAFLEDWYLEIDGARQRSFAVRSWDAATRTWRLVWVADPDHFQIWDGLRLADGWYIIRKFGEGADAFLSRQAWIPQGPDRLYRTIERSTDGGATWTTRTRGYYQRVSPGAGPS